MKKQEASTNTSNIIVALELAISRALWGEVIPSLREVILKWEPNQNLAKILFYHHGQITPSIQNHYSCIVTEVDAGYYGEQLNIDHEVIRLDYPQPLPKQEFVIYSRREPFENPTELD